MAQKQAVKDPGVELLLFQLCENRPTGRLAWASFIPMLFGAPAPTLFLPLYAVQIGKLACRLAPLKELSAPASPNRASRGGGGLAWGPVPRILEIRQAVGGVCLDAPRWPYRLASPA
jgi:hypothetical protein